MHHCTAWQQSLLSLLLLFLLLVLLMLSMPGDLKQLLALSIIALLTAIGVVQRNPGDEALCHFFVSDQQHASLSAVSVMMSTNEQQLRRYSCVL